MDPFKWRIFVEKENSSRLGDVTETMVTQAPKQQTARN